MDNFYGNCFNIDEDCVYFYNFKQKPKVYIVFKDVNNIKVFSNYNDAKEELKLSPKSKIIVKNVF